MFGLEIVRFSDARLSRNKIWLKNDTGKSDVENDHYWTGSKVPSFME